MAETGFRLVIPQEMINRLAVADEKIEKIAKTSEDAQKRIDASFKAMAQGGIDEFIKKLNQAQQAMNSLKNTNLQVGSINQLTNNAVNAADNINRLIEVLDKLTQSLNKGGDANKTKIINPEEDIQRIAELKKEISEINTILKKGGDENGALDMAMQQELVNRRDALKQELKLQEESDRLRNERIKKEEKQNQRRSEQEIAEARRVYQEKAKLYRQANEVYNKTYKGSLDFSSSAKTYDREVQAIKYLEAARNSLSKTDADYANKLNILNEAIRRHQESLKQATLTDKERTEASKKSAEEAIRNAQRIAQAYEKRRETVLDKWYSSSDTRALGYSSNAKTYEEQAKAIEYLTNARNKLNTTDADYKRRLEALNIAIRENQKAMKNATLTDAERLKLSQKSREAAIREAEAYERRKRAVLNSWHSSSSQRALGYSSNAKTLEQDRNAIKYLEAARAQLNRTDRDYEATLKRINKAILQHKRNIDQATQGSKNLQNSHRGLMNISEQLTRRLALVFSVSQITGYVNKLISVRGEFELQQRSLQAILQNKDEADKLWQQTIDLAVRSPFRVKELVTYTKQLAAYRVETEKLHNTTKMLSDVSAGLGVDMQRLILAYGQVKAANYLRGTELRQFSEAGINILGELAKYFSELEGRAISVGDVFERVSKRMVAFSDVEEIFKRLTSEGGTFYRMQEIQSETLKGMVSNLKDSIDLMLNDIGRANDDTIKSSITLIKSFVDNWRELAFVIKAFVIPSLGTYLTISSMIKVANSAFASSLLNVAMRFKATETALIASEKGLVKFLTRIGLGANATRGFIKALGGLATLGVAGIIAGITISLVALITKLTRASREAKQLQKDLKEIYTQDTANLDLQIRSYENLIARLKDVNIASKEHKDIINQLNSQYGDYIGFIVTEKTTYEQLANSIDGVTLAMTRRAKMATFEKALSKVYESTNQTILDNEKVVKETFEKFSQRELDGKIVAFKPTAAELDKIFKEIENKTEELNRELSQEEMAQAIGNAIGFRTFFTTDARTIENFYDAIRKRTDAILKRKEEELKINQEINSLYKDNAVNANAARLAFDDLAKKEKEALDAASAKPKWEQEKIKRDYAIQKIDLQVQWEGLDKATAEFRKKMLNDTDATINDINKKIEANSKKLGEGYANLIYIDSTQATTGISQIAESTAVAYKAQKEIIKQQNALKDAGTVYDEAILKNAEKTAAAYYYKLRLLGRLDLLEKEQNKEEKKELQLLNKQISALKEARQTFDSLREKFGIAEATSRTAKAFEDLFKELNMKDLTLGMSFDISGVMKVLSKLPNLAGDAGRIAIEKFNAELQGGLDVDAQVLADTKLLREIENMFTGYEVSLELQKLNIPKDWAKEFFDVDTFDLSDIRTKIESELQKEIGKDRRKELEKDLEKVKEMEVKAQQERLKTYLQYARDAVGDRAKIKLEEMKKLQEIEKTFTKPEQQDVKQKAIAKVKADSQKEQQKLDWEEFQKSDTFISLFSDLDSASSALINHSIEKLREFKEQWKDMPLEDMKSIVSKINELEIALAQIKPFRGGKELLESLRQMEESAKFDSSDAQKLGKEKEYAIAFEMERAYQEERLKNTNQQISDLESLIALKEEGKDIDVIALGYSDAQQEMYAQGVDYLKEELDFQKMIAKDSKDKIKNSTSYLATLTKQQKKQLAQADAISKANNMANDLYDAFNGLIEVFGKGDGIGAIFADMGMQMLNTVMNTIALQLQLKAASVQAQIFGIQMNASMGIIGWIVMAVQLIAQGLGAIFAAHDKRLEKQIEDLADEVDLLNKKLEELEENLDNAFNISQLQQYTKEIKRNINAQITAYEQMIKLEEDKKKADEDKVDEYKDKIGELKETQKELQEEAVSTATSGILDSVKDAARDFVDAWYEAFSETGDGLQGLKDNFKEIMLDMVQQQASMAIAGNFLDRWKTQLDNYINKNDLELTSQEAAQWADTVQKELPQLNEALKAYFKALEQAGIDLNGTTSELSGLQKGIQGITETQADVIAAYLNSMRFFVSDSNSKLTILVNSFTNSETPNPILSELRSQTDLIRTIRDMFSSVIGRGNSTHSGAYLKVVM